MASCTEARTLLMTSLLLTLALSTGYQVAPGGRRQLARQAACGVRLQFADDLVLNGRLSASHCFDRGRLGHLIHTFLELDSEHDT